MSKKEKALTGIKDVDHQVLLNLDDTSIYNICLTNKYLNSLCDDEFWRLRFLAKYGKNTYNLVLNAKKRWKLAYFDQDRMENYSVLYEDTIAKVKTSDDDYQEVERDVRESIKSNLNDSFFIDLIVDVILRQTSLSDMDIVRKKDVPSHMKDGDILKSDIYRILIDMGNYFILPKFILFMYLNSYGLSINLELSYFSIYELFKHGPMFFKYIVKYIHDTYNKKDNKNIWLKFKTADGLPFYHDKNQKKILNLLYDEKGNLMMDKSQNIKIYTYKGMTLILPYKHDAY
jgi:hypothetical protein